MAGQQVKLFKKGALTPSTPGLPEWDLLSNQDACVSPAGPAAELQPAQPQQQMAKYVEQPLPCFAHSAGDYQTLMEALDKLGLQRNPETLLANSGRLRKGVTPPQIKEHFDELYQNCPWPEWDGEGCNLEVNPQMAMATSALQKIVDANGIHSHLLLAKLTGNAKLLTVWQQDVRHNEGRRAYMKHTHTQISQMPHSIIIQTKGT